MMQSTLEFSNILGLQSKFRSFCIILVGDYIKYIHIQKQRYAHLHIHKQFHNVQTALFWAQFYSNTLV